MQFVDSADVSGFDHISYFLEVLKQKLPAYNLVLHPF